MFPADVNAALALAGQSTAFYVSRHTGSRNLVDDNEPDGNIKKESWWMRLLRAFVPHFEAVPYLVPYNSHEEIEYYTRVGHQGALYYPASHPTLCTSCVGPAGPGAEPEKLTTGAEPLLLKRDSIRMPSSVSSDKAGRVGASKKMTKAVESHPCKTNALHQQRPLDYLIRDSARAREVGI
eukprot:jgi/Botrbrau1/12555/Bobra.0169s0091.1